MHLQASVEGFDKFARSLSIGAETMVMDFRPDEPMHNRYAVSHDFLTPETGDEILTISRLINAFFRWEFNSCETLVRGTEAHPIDYANASPGRRADLAALLLAVGDQRAVEVVDLLHRHRAARRARPTSTRTSTSRSATARTSRYEEKLAEYRKLADNYFQVDQYTEFCATALKDVDDLMLDWISSTDFDALLVETVQTTYPAHEQEEFLAHFRGLLGLWANERGRSLQSV